MRPTERRVRGPVASEASMKTILNILIFALVLFTCGCTTSSQNKQLKLWQEFQSGEMTETEYQRALRDHKESQPWGNHEEEQQSFQIYL